MSAQLDPPEAVRHMHSAGGMVTGLPATPGQTSPPSSRPPAPLDAAREADGHQRTGLGSAADDQDDDGVPQEFDLSNHGRRTQPGSASEQQPQRLSHHSLRQQMFSRKADRGAANAFEIDTLPKAGAAGYKPELDVSEGSGYAYRKRKRKHSWAPATFVPQWVRTSYLAVESRVVYHYKTVAGLHALPPTKEGRKIHVDAENGDEGIDERTGKPYMANSVRSSRYTLWSFLPKQLYAQFTKLANFYFLCISILQLIPGLSTTGTITTIVPLAIFVTFAMCKEGYDDYRRYKLDRTENNAYAQVLQRGPCSNATDERWKRTKWLDVRVGDIIRLERDDSIPADMILLHVNGLNGIAYIETHALDGETNLKPKQALPTIAERCDTMAGLAAFKGDLIVEDPNLDLYNFEGQALFDDGKKPLTNSHVVYRGSVLRNTQTAVGVVIFAGEECKIRMNTNKNARTKAPRLQTTLNKIVFVTIFFVIGISFFCTAGYVVWKGVVEDKAWYLHNASVSFGQVLASFIIIFDTLIPLSLYIVLEIVKICQIFFLNDIDMYDPVTDTPFEAHTSTINEDCGLITHIFSDKTGTLTDNFMLFRKLSVAGLAWLHNLDIEQEAGENLEQTVSKKRASKGKGKQRKEERPPNREASSSLGPPLQANSTARGSFDKSLARMSSSESRSWKASANPRRVQPQMNTYDLVRYLQEHPNTSYAQKTKFFLLALALCHTALPETDDNGTVSYQASSPDEVALVKAAMEMGYIAIERRLDSIIIKSYPHGPTGEEITEKYEVLDVIEFSSMRKRMSIIIRLPDGKICVFSKGADSTMMQLLRQKELAAQKVHGIENLERIRHGIQEQEAMRKLSMHGSGSPGEGRLSFTHGRSRPSTEVVDEWIRDDMNDVGMTPMENASIYSRPSGQFESRPSMAGSDLVIDDAMADDEGLVIERCFAHVNDFASEGLRTLLYCHRFVDESEYTTWKKIYSDANASLVNRKAQIEQAADMIEQDFELTGATAIEDKLQKGVPESIDKLRRANIKLWMLTGDKRETAINIGHSCRLIKDYSKVVVLDRSDSGLEHKMQSTMSDLIAGRIAHSVVVIDGGTLSEFEQNNVLEDLFFDLAILASTVICCRASPSQKQSLVRSVRTKVKNSVTLAIGDGANDIAMIQEAHVGVGITGKEGLQAARVADYSMAQFRFLVKFLLVHGRWNYRRTCKYILSTFWKEFSFYLMQMVFQRWAGFTGTSLYEPWSIATFNTVFTSFSILMVGVIDKELEPFTLLAVPELYKKVQTQTSLSFKRFFGWIVLGICNALMVYFIVMCLYGHNVAVPNDLFAVGNAAFSAMIVVITTKLLILDMHSKSQIAFWTYLGTVVFWLIWEIILCQLYTLNPTTDIYRVRGNFFENSGHELTWWLVVLFAVSVCLILDLGIRALQVAFWPSEVDIFREIERVPELRLHLMEAASDELRQGWEGDGKPTVELASKGQDVQLLDAPRRMEEGDTARRGSCDVPGARTGPPESEEDLQARIAKRFGSIIRRG